jgi:hypothetical protein
MSEFDLRRQEGGGPFSQLMGPILGAMGMGGGKGPAPGVTPQTQPAAPATSPAGGTAQGLPAAPMAAPNPAAAGGQGPPLGPDGQPDFVGEADRGLARAQLAGKFQVVGPDYQGPRNHNTVSPEEYERIVKAYSDIRLGRGDLTIDSSEFAGTPQEAQYRSGVMDNIAMMMQTTAGREQIFTLGDNILKDDQGNARKADGSAAAPGEEVHRKTTIRALHQDANGDKLRNNDNDAPLDHTNAFSDLTGRDGSPMDAVRTQQWYRQAVDPTDHTKGTKRGAGTDATIYWNPHEVQIGGVGEAFRPDVVLAHEMQHARHQTQGTMAGGYVDQAAHLSDSLHGIAASEHQAAGIGRWAPGAHAPGGVHFPGDADGCTENTYRQQRNDLGDNLPMRSMYASAQHPFSVAPSSPVPVPTSGTGDVTARNPAPTTVSGPQDSTQRHPAPAPVPTTVAGPQNTTQRMPAGPNPAPPAMPWPAPAPVPTTVSGPQDTTQRLPGMRRAA